MADMLSGTYEVMYRSADDDIQIRGEIWLLGRRYNLPQDMQAMEQHISSLIWCTYRKNFRAIGGTGLTSDASWGCTMRCGQMVLAEALSRLHLGRDWRWTAGTGNRSYHALLRMFLDKPDSVYSLQQIAQFGVDFNRKVGEWFGPNNMCQVIKKMAKYDGWSNLAIHIAMDMTIVESEIYALCKGVEVTGAKRHSYQDGHMKSISPAEESPDGATANGGVSLRCDEFKPLLLFVPLRLGLETFEKQYSEPLKACLHLPQSIGMIGGRPRMAFWFYGCQKGDGGKLFYLDPHTVQASVEPVRDRIPDETFHNVGRPSLMNMYELEPSMAVGFFCANKEELEDLFNRLRRDVLAVGPALFEIFTNRPANMPALVIPDADLQPLDDPEDVDEAGFDDLMADSSLAAVAGAGHNSCADEEFEIIEMGEVM